MSLASYRAALSRDNYMAEKKGFEPLRRFRPPGFQDQSLQPDLGISPFPSLKEQIDYITLKKIKSTIRNTFFTFFCMFHTIYMSFLSKINLKSSKKIKFLTIF